MSNHTGGTEIKDTKTPTCTESGYTGDTYCKDCGAKLSSGEILLLVLGSPLWLSLLIAAAAVVISLYASLWAVVISLWAAFVSVVAGAFAGVVGGAFLTFANASSSIFMIGAGIFCIGAAILLLHGCKAATKGAIRLGAYPVSLLVKKWRER